MILSVKLNNMNWSIPIERRFTVVRGDSGKGKTVMIDLISNRNNGLI